MKVREVLAGLVIALVPIIGLAGSASAEDCGGGDTPGGRCAGNTAPGNSGTTPGADKGAKKGWTNPANPHYTPGGGDPGPTPGA